MAKIESMLKEAEDNEKEEQDTKDIRNRLSRIVLAACPLVGFISHTC